MMKYYTIIVAGGTGSRMGAKLPKQFLELEGKAILLHTIAAFEEAFGENSSEPDALRRDAQIILVLHPDYVDYWYQLIEKQPPKTKILLTEGGQTRFHSVKNGFDLVEDKESIIGIHDAVRPFVTTDFLRRIYKAAETQGAVIPTIPLKDSVRLIDETGSKALERSSLRAVQTPQCFRYNVLEAAYQQEYRSYYTDDASLVESAGFSIQLIDGLETNIKITTPIDLAWSNLFAAK